MVIMIMITNGNRSVKRTSDLRQTRRRLSRMASRLTVIASFPSVFIQLLQYLKQHPSFSAHWAALITKLT